MRKVIVKGTGRLLLWIYQFVNHATGVEIVRQRTMSLMWLLLRAWSSSRVLEILLTLKNCKVLTLQVRFTKNEVAIFWFCMCCCLCIGTFSSIFIVFHLAKPHMKGVLFEKLVLSKQQHGALKFPFSTGGSRRTGESSTDLSIQVETVGFKGHLKLYCWNYT